jgi:CelD/BcsL family acetyltransferase involved in cellulose biosynthesis
MLGRVIPWTARGLPIPWQPAHFVCRAGTRGVLPALAGKVNAVTRLELLQLDSIAQLRALSEAWDRLWLRSEVSIPTARAELVAQWLEHFAPRDQLRVLIVRQEGKLVAALPLVSQRRRRLLTVGDLTWNCWSPNGELLLDPAVDADRVLDRLTEALEQLPWPLLWLDLVPYASVRWQSLLKAFHRRGWMTDVHPRYQIGQVDLGDSFADYEASRSSNLRRSVRKDLQRLERAGPVKLHVLTEFDSGQLAQGLRQAFEIENRSWKADDGQPVLQVPGMFEFYLRQTQQLARWGQLQLAFLEHQDRRIAFEVGWTAKGIYHSYKVGYDAAYRGFGPGHLLRRLLMERLARGGDIHAVDFQGPLTEALASWATHAYPIGRVLAARPTLTGRTLMAGYRTAAPLVRWWRGAPGDSVPGMVSLPNVTVHGPLSDC